MRFEILRQLNEVLGKGKRTYKDNYEFKCPFCNHPKPNLEVNLKNGKWHCWVCDAKGTSISSLFRRLGHHFNGDFILVDGGYDDLDINEELVLPDGVQFLGDGKFSSEKKVAFEYLRRRGISLTDICRYNVGVVENSYGLQLVFPSYTRSGQLNLFVQRTIVGNGSKYYIRKLSNSIPFEYLLSNKIPVILVEGVFDMITVGGNALPLLGNKLSKSIINWILSGCKDVVICLDGDARREAIKIARKLFLLGVNVRLVLLPSDSDPNSVGREKVWGFINSAIQYDLNIELKLELNGN